MRRDRVFFAFILMSMIAASASATPVALTPVKIHMLADASAAFQQQSLNWFPALQKLAMKLLWLLAGVDFAWAASTWVLERKEFGEIIVAITKKIFIYGFWSAMIQWGQLGPTIISYFVEGGQNASGLGAISPDTVLGYGLAAWSQIAVAAKSGGVLQEVVMAIPLAIDGFVIALCFAVVAGQLFITTIESYIVGGAGIIMLGTGGSRWTAEMASAYPKYAVGVGVKLMMCYLITGVGIKIFGTYVIDPNDLIGTSQDLVVQVLIFAFVAWSIPSFAASMVSGSASSTLGGALGAAATAVVAGGMAGSAIKKVGSEAVSSLKDALGGGGKSSDALGGGPGSISGSSGGFGGPAGMSPGGRASSQSGVGPAYSQPPVATATPTLPVAAREAQAERARVEASNSGSSAGSSSSAAIGKADAVKPKAAIEAGTAAAGSANAADENGMSNSVPTNDLASNATSAPLPASVTFEGGTGNDAAPGPVAAAGNFSAVNPSLAAAALAGGSAVSNYSSTPTSDGSAAGSTAQADAAAPDLPSGNIPGAPIASGAAPTGGNSSAATRASSPAVNAGSVQSSSVASGGSSSGGAGTAIASPASYASPAPSIESGAAPNPGADVSAGSQNQPSPDANANKDKGGAGPRTESIADRLARARQHYIHQDGANVQVGGISTAHGKD